MTDTTTPTTTPLWEHTLPTAPASAPSADHITDTARDATTRARTLLDTPPTTPTHSSTSSGSCTADPAAQQKTPPAPDLAPPTYDACAPPTTWPAPPAVRVSLYLHTPDPLHLTTATQTIHRLRRATAAPLAIDHNRITDPDAHVQVRLGPDGLAYPFTAVQDDWVLARRPTLCPGDAYTAARQALRSRRG